MASASVVTAGRTGQLNPIVWIDAARRQWIRLVDEARAEYEATRAPSIVVANAAGAVSDAASAPPIVVASATGAVPEAGSVVVLPRHEEVPTSLVIPENGTRTRDQRGRFIRRATNGVQPE
jgi:hypothetical protein